MGNNVLFLDPVSLETVEVLGGYAPRVHEFAISRDRARAYAPIYGDGMHGNNPKRGHLIAVLDLQLPRHAGDFSVAPLFGSARDALGLCLPALLCL